MTSSLLRSAGKLASREIRKTATGGQIMRKLDNKTPIDKNAIWDWFKGMVGWVAEKLMAIVTGIFTFNFSDAWDRLQNDYFTMYNWDFNVTDADLDNRIKAMDKQIKVMAAEQVGRTIGTVLAGVAGIGGAFMLNAQLGMYLLQEAGTEIVQDWVGEVSAAILGMKQINEQKKFIRRFQSMRRTMKFLLNNPVGASLASLVGIDMEKVKSWGEEKRKPWTYAGKVDAAVKSLPGDWADMGEAALEGFGEAFWETGYIIAGALDSFFFDEALRDTPGQVNGQQQTIALIPDRSVPSERVVLSGRTENLRSTIVTTLATHELLKNRDSGISIIGNDGEEFPIVNSNGIKIIITLYNYKEPPYWTTERRKKIIKTEIILENVKRTSVDWNKIKVILGTSAVITKGEWKCIANLDNGKKLIIWTDTPKEGERFLEKLVTLIEPDIIYPLQFTEHIGKGNNKAQKFKEANAMYAAHMVIINYDRLSKYESFNNSKGTPNPYKNPKFEKVKIQLHYDEKPSWVDAEIAKILDKTPDLQNPTTK
jgi:hypothetical protein